MEHSTLSSSRFFGIQWKLLLLLTFVSCFFVAIAAVSFYGLIRIEQSSDIIILEQTPYVRSIQEALSSMVIGQSTTEQALDIEDPESRDRLDALSSEFADSVVQFNMFMAAITWGSETDAFKKSGGGENYNAWVRNGYTNSLVVRESSPEQADLAGNATIYYEGFVNNTERATNSRRDYLTLLGSGKMQQAELAKADSKEFVAVARYYSGLVIVNLREMVTKSNTETSASAVALKKTENDVRFATIVITLVGFILSLFVSIFFARYVVVRPITRLRAVALGLAEGDFSMRASTDSRDEIGELGFVFNQMAERLMFNTEKLEDEVVKRTEELKRNVGNLKVANERLLQLDKTKSDFISIAAHQLRTPLSAIKWTLSVLMEEESVENLTTEQRTLLMKGYESNERIIRLINDMLVVTRIESGKVEYKKVSVHMEDIIESALIDFAAYAQARKMKLVFNKPTPALPFMDADPDKIRSVLQNLIENAMGYTKDGGEITISCSSVAGAIEVAIQDNGPGIPKIQQSSIFNKFFRADNALKIKTDGSGLGLFIAKSIVEKHGGKIWFESTENVGTTFHFTVPLSGVSE